jgi:hypothetical protein
MRKLLRPILVDVLPVAVITGLTMARDVGLPVEAGQVRAEICGARLVYPSPGLASVASTSDVQEWL